MKAAQPAFQSTDRRKMRALEQEVFSTFPHYELLSELTQKRIADSFGMEFGFGIGEFRMRRAILSLVGGLLLTTSANSEPFSGGYLQFCVNTVHSGAAAIAMQYSQQQIERNLCMAQKYSALATQDSQPGATQKACADATKVMTNALSKRFPSENPKSVAGDC